MRFMIVGGVPVSLDPSPKAQPTPFNPVIHPEKVRDLLFKLASIASEREAKRERSRRRMIHVTAPRRVQRERSEERRFKSALQGRRA